MRKITTVVLLSYVVAMTIWQLESPSTNVLAFSAPIVLLLCWVLDGYLSDRDWRACAARIRAQRDEVTAQRDLIAGAVTRYATELALDDSVPTSAFGAVRQLGEDVYLVMHPEVQRVSVQDEIDVLKAALEGRAA